MTSLLRRAERAHGVVTARDLADVGIGGHRVRRWLDRGVLHRIGRGVYRIGGAPPTKESEILGATLVHGRGTWASHRTAAWLWGLPGHRAPSRIDVTRAQEHSNERDGVRVHRSTRLLPHHVARVRSIPVTSLPRTVFDLAGCVGRPELERSVEAALRTRHASIGSCYRVLEELAGKGRAGTVAMREVLSWRGRDYVPSESELDLLGREVVAAIDGIEWQVEISDDQGYIRRVDGLHRASGVVIEWDGAAFHDAPTQRTLDAAGDRRLEAIGRTVLRFRWADVTERPADVRARVREAIEAGTPVLGTLSCHERSEKVPRTGGVGGGGGAEERVA